MKILLSRPFNIVAFNLMWLACVLGREQLFWVVAPLVLAYVCLLIGSGTLRAQQILIPAAVGIIVDLIMTATGLFAFTAAPLLLPMWLLVLWLAFSTTLGLSLSFIGRNKFVAAATGALAFPFNYGVGERLGAVEFPLSYSATLLTLAGIWMFLLPVLFRASEPNLERQLETNPG